MLSVFCYTEFTVEITVEIPVAGKLFVFSASLLLTDNNPILPFDQNPNTGNFKSSKSQASKTGRRGKIS